jgi:hypothetical protein
MRDSWNLKFPRLYKTRRGPSVAMGYYYSATAGGAFISELVVIQRVGLHVPIATANPVEQSFDIS